ncbi:hypothetical protein ACS0PU_008450 [Formica fusca]
MYVTETGGHKVAPAPASTRLKKVDYNKSMIYQHHHHPQQHHHHHQHRHEGGGDRGGATHIAATVKNTMRRLLRRTKSHRDTPSTNASTMTPVVANGHAVVPPPTRIPTRNDTCSAVPPSSDNYLRRRQRARPQVREKENERFLL